MCDLGHPRSVVHEAKQSYTYQVIRQGEDKLRKSKLNSVFHHLPGPKQLCLLADLGYTLLPNMYRYIIFRACQK